MSLWGQILLILFYILKNLDSKLYIKIAYYNVFFNYILNISYYLEFVFPNVYREQLWHFCLVAGHRTTEPWPKPFLSPEALNISPRFPVLLRTQDRSKDKYLKVEKN